MLIKSVKPTPDKVKKQDSKENKKLQQELFEHKLITVALKRKMAEMDNQHRASKDA